MYGNKHTNTTYVELVTVAAEDFQHSGDKIVADALGHAVTQVVALDLKDPHKVEVAEGGRDFSAELVPVQPHLLHQSQVSEGFRNGSGKATLGDRKRLEGRQASEEGWDFSAKPGIAIDPVFENDGHVFHVRQIAGNHGIGRKKVFEVWEFGDLRWNRAVELDAVHQQKSQRGKVFKGCSLKVTGNQAVGNVQFNQSIGEFRWEFSGEHGILYVEVTCCQ